jgi:hypothetical protein
VTRPVTRRLTRGMSGMSPRAQLAVSSTVLITAVITMLSVGTGRWQLATAAAAAGLPALAWFLAAWRLVFPPAADLAPWTQARTLADLGELTAQWLEGTIPAEPGYCGGPDPETLPLVPVLAWLNRAGYVTDGSQPGDTGGSWEQRAAVSGFAAPQTARVVIAAADAAGLIVITDPVTPRRRTRLAGRQPVTRIGGRPCTWFGATLPARHLRDPWTGYGICHRDAVDALCQAWQVTVIDPEWGRDSLLWPVLAAAVTPQNGCSPARPAQRRPR